jgi:hypothetical protein
MVSVISSHRSASGSGAMPRAGLPATRRASGRRSAEWRPWRAMKSWKASVPY